MSGQLAISPDLKLPAEAVTQTFAILAKRGVGKTYTASVMTEEMLKAGLPVVVCDPIGVWWGLRSSATGKSDGLPIIVLGGDHGDAPLEDTAGTVIADLVADERVSLVIDLSHFRKAGQVRFMTDFAERLYHRNRQPVHLMLDEADAFAPQRPMKGTERLLGAIEDLVRRGRARGLGMTLITQRPAVLNKNVLTQIEVLVTLRMVAPQDRAAIDEWIRVHGEPEQREELMASLPSLPIGAAWFWSPGWLDLFQRVTVRKRETFDSSATPELGAAPLEPRKLADVDLAALEKRMADTIERAKADDPRELRRRIKELEAKLANPPEPERVEIPVLTDDAREALEQAASAIAAAQSQMVDAIADASRRLGEIVAQVGARPAPPPPPAQPRQPDAAPRRAPAPAPRPRADPPPRVPEDLDTHLKAGALRILQTLAGLHPLRVTKAQVGTLTGFKVTGGTFQTYWSTLKRAGYVTEEGTDVVVTDAGLERAGAVPPAPATTEEMVAMWAARLKRGAREMLDRLVAAHPAWVTKDELADELGMTATGGTFQTYLSTLRRNGLADIDGQHVRAGEALFITATR